MHEQQWNLRDVGGWMLYLSALMGLAIVLPVDLLIAGHPHFVFALSAIGLWRYGLRLVHFVRGMYFLYVVYPAARRRARALGEAARPSEVFLMVTSFRIDAQTTAAVYRATIEEAIACGYQATVVASIVEYSDELIIRALWKNLAPPARVSLKFVRIPGTGKRDGLAHGFRAISRTLPDHEALVAVIDGDTVLAPGVIARSAPYFKLFPRVGGLTTNEFCKVEGSYWMSEWHKLRFAQRHLNMCSMALTRRVLTLTGRMSMFRAEVVTQPEFIADVERDAIWHWRLGRFKFLTGDDKSTWYSLMRLGYDTYYVPDAAINTVEHPPDKRFGAASRKLMFRWYGNSLRQNSRAMKLGPQRLGWFTYYSLIDQRITMWTSILGLTIAIVAALQFSIWYLLGYLLWIGTTRLLMTLILVPTGHPIGPAYPALLFYNQIIGAVMKIYVFFRLDQQSWTRQNTKLKRDLDPFQIWFNRASSWAMTFSAVSVFIALIVKLVSIRVL